MGRVIAVASQKGGVGKTTTSVNLGAALATAGREVVLLDADAQANASSGLGLPLPASRGFADLCSPNGHIESALAETPVSGLRAIPSGGPMRQAERWLAGSGTVAHAALRRAVEVLRSEHDLVLIDCPPALGAVTATIMSLADEILIPVQCEYYAMEGLVQIMGVADALREAGRGRAKVSGILMTMFDSRSVLCGEVVAEVRGHFKELVFTTVIPRDNCLAEAPGHGKPGLVYDVRAPGSWAYARLAREVIIRG